ncbi:hypothetical protein BDFB_011799 [Asbolus verrucosus]|uniref:Uncharacterized protein n=1 Tax=Asbolus verrucosus TaxID=1661398 RepID=A0A482WA64_ASBVE|nr:hypothetical protein BDFB_011799 [Asbolus verrucosus]
MTLNGALSNEDKVVEKRNSCLGGDCGGTSCGGGGSCNPYQPYEPYYHDPNIPERHYYNPNPASLLPRRPINTCTQCVNSCSNRCSNNQCLSGCLGSCSCNGRNTDTNSNCCYVMHPKQCYTDNSGDKRCVIRRHRECSDLCSSSVVSIQEKRVNGGTSGCQYIRNFPYVYCGNYERENCGQCYNCGGRYNPRECFRRRECTDTCRNSIPNCVRTQASVECY